MSYQLRDYEFLNKKKCCFETISSKKTLYDAFAATKENIFKKTRTISSSQSAVNTLKMAAKYRVVQCKHRSPRTGIWRRVFGLDFATFNQFCLIWYKGLIVKLLLNSHSSPDQIRSSISWFKWMVFSCFCFFLNILRIGRGGNCCYGRKTISWIILVTFDSN